MLALLAGCVRVGLTPPVGSDSGGSDPNGSAGVDPNTPEDDPNTPPDPNSGPSAVVSDVVCDEFAVISGLPESGDVTIYQALGSRNFSNWRDGDIVEPASGAEQLRNVTRDRTIVVTVLGARGGAANVLSPPEATPMLWLTDGTVWSIELADALTAQGWRTSDTVVIVGDARGGRTVRLLNVTRCNVVSARLQSQ
jgi:hypothetical protein